MRRVLEIIESYGAYAFPKQATLARRAGMPISTLRKMLARLVEDGKLRIQQRGPTSSEYQRLTPQIGQAFGKAFGQASRPYLFTELKQSEEEQAAPVQIPPMFVVNEYGSRLENPEWHRYQAVLRRIQARSARSRNPRAYEAAVLRAEGFGSASKRSGTGVPVSGEVAPVSGRLLASGETKAADTNGFTTGDPAPMPPQRAQERVPSAETPPVDTLHHPGQNERTERALGAKAGG